MSSTPGAGEVFFEARCERSTFVTVVCEHCGRDYICSVTVWAEACQESTGTARGDHEAKKRAEAIANAVLIDGLENVRPGLAPCAYCGWIQRSMFEAARAELPTTMFRFGVFLILVGGILAAPPAAFFSYGPPIVENTGVNPIIALVLWTATACLLLAGFLISAYAIKRRREYDPNSESLESRLARAKQTSIPKELYNELLAGCSPSSIGPRSAKAKLTESIEDATKKSTPDADFEPKTP